MAKKRAFVKYTKSGEIVPGSLIVSTKGGFPRNGLYTEVPVDLCCAFTPFVPTIPTRSRAFIRYTKKGKIVPGSLIIITEGGYPINGTYLELSVNICCNANPNFIRLGGLVPVSSCVGINPCNGRCTVLDVYMSQECSDNPEIDCQVWTDDTGTIPVPDGEYLITLPGNTEGVMTIAGGLIIAVQSCT